MEQIATRRGKPDTANLIHPPPNHLCSNDSLINSQRNLLISKPNIKKNNRKSHKLKPGAYY
jgi:hypothetical protein